MEANDAIIDAERQDLILPCARRAGAAMHTRSDADKTLWQRASQPRKQRSARAGLLFSATIGIIWVLPPLSNSWIIIIIWLYIALNRTPNIDCYWRGQYPRHH